jgi:4-amino-4-deoxy-L-arabinose transferase-like glycosyltransferase
MLQQMDCLGPGLALSTDRPLLFLVLYSVQVCLHIEAEVLLKHLQILLTGALVVSTYLLTDCCFKDERLAILSALLASVFPHVTVGIRYFIVGNWFALVLLTLFLTAVLRSLESKSEVWAALAVTLSWLTLGIHFPTWIFSMLVVVIYAFITYRLQTEPKQV